MNDLVWWAIGFASGYAIHALVAMQVCPPYRVYFENLTRKSPP